MLKARKHAPQKMMRRTARVFLGELNPSKAKALRDFLLLCHDAMQYFIDLFWQKKDFSAKLADLETVHRGCEHFGLTTRLAQALAKQAKECVRSAHANKRRKPHKRGTFPRVFNRRLSHWLYAYAAQWLGRRCEEKGIRLERKSPWKTSQFCRLCRRWDRRNRVGDRFCCVYCGFSEHADLNAARNLALLGEAGVYGLRSLPNLGLCTISQSSG